MTWEKVSVEELAISGCPVGLFVGIKLCLFLIKVGDPPWVWTAVFHGLGALNCMTKKVN